jgi:hypothetical protein
VAGTDHQWKSVQVQNRAESACPNVLAGCKRWQIDNAKQSTDEGFLFSLLLGSKHTGFPFERLQNVPTLRNVPIPTAITCLKTSKASTEIDSDQRV